MELSSISWVFLIACCLSGGFGALLGIFVIAPIGKRTWQKTLDTIQRLTGGAIAAGLWGWFGIDYSGLSPSKLGHITAVCGGIGFGWWFIGGGVALLLDRFRKHGPSRMPLINRLGWISELINSMKVDPPDSKGSGGNKS